MLLLKYHVGGGGGHQLHVEDCSILVERDPEAKPCATPPAPSAGSAGYAAPAEAATCATAPPSKEQMQALIKEEFAQLVASGVPPQEAAMQALAKVKERSSSAPST